MSESGPLDHVQDRTGGRSGRNRQAAHDAVLGLLDSSEDVELTIELIAAHSGLNRATIYRRWGSVEHLVLDAIAARAANDVAVPDMGSLRADLIALAREIAAILSTPTAASMASALVAGRRDSRQAAVIDDFFESRYAASRIIVDRATASGELAPEVDANELLDALSGALYFPILFRGRRFSSVELESTVDRLIRGFAA